MANKKTKIILANKVFMFANHLEADGDMKEANKLRKMASKAKTAKNWVNIFMNMAWDYESFTSFITHSRIPNKDKKEFIYEATRRESEWDT
ncbi:MAG: hypothetical protein AABY22_08715 [Nanoarchaeota archaeon]